MNHLRIIQSDAPEERVTGTIIEKLADICRNNLLDETSDLQGHLIINHAYKEDVTYLLETYPNLEIEVTGSYYIKFADPVVQQLLTNAGYGDGIGITSSDAATILFGGTLAASAIETFNEFKYFILQGQQNSGYSFSNCSSLTSIDISNLSIIPSWLFNNCTSLSIEMPETINLGSGGGLRSFYNCLNLQFPDSITVTTTEWRGLINSHCFERCRNLKKVVFDASVKAICRAAFGGCSNLTTLEGTENITRLSEDSFSYSGITEANFPNCVGYLSDWIDGESQSSIGTFSNCKSLKKVVLGDMEVLGLSNAWVTMASNRPVFSNCTNLTTVDVKSLQVFPNMTDTIFRNTPNMANFIIRSSTVPPLQHSDQTLVIGQFGSSNVKIYVPDEAVDTYKNAEGWENVALYIYPISEYIEE